MFSKKILNNNIPQLHLQDSVVKALQLMNDFRIEHLPIVSENVYLGFICEDDLIDVDDKNLSIETLQNDFVKASVLENTHFLNAASFAINFDTSIVPVVNIEGEYIGVISNTELLKTIGNFAGADEIGGLIVLEMKRSQFAISEISRIVESNDCTILHLNTTTDALTGLLTVTIHINKKEISSVLSTFERYDYTITYSYGIEK
ncbi:MAG: CBS domain-containing protein, partial [Ferruginibacter sp.]